MSAYALQIIAVLLALAALFGWLNARFIRLPATMGVMALGLVVSALIIAAGSAMPPLRQTCENFVEHIDFRHSLLDGMLAFLLFAAALQLDPRALRGQWGTIGALAILGTPISAGLIAAMLYGMLTVMGRGPGVLDCLLLGTVLSPTDPIAVVGMLKRVRTPRRLEVQLAGESLFNDGIAAVLFLTLLEARAGNDVSTAHVLAMLARQGMGGALVGGVLGFVSATMLQWISEENIELMITLALAAGSYALADALGLSGVISVVCAGVVLGHLRGDATGKRRWGPHVDAAWELIDETLNVLLFLLMGLEVLVMSLRIGSAGAALAAAGQVLLARLISVGLVAVLLRMVIGRRAPDAKDVAVLTWGGLRGGLSVALALALPKGPQYSTQVALTYGVVIFSIFAQGLTISGLIRYLRPRLDEGDAKPAGVSLPEMPRGG